MKKILAILLMAAVILSLCACADDAEYSKEIIGTWERDIGHGEVSRLTFYEDGKMDDGRYELTGNKLKIVKGEEWIEEYIISIENDTLTLSWSEGLFGSTSSEYKRVKVDDTEYSKEIIGTWERDIGHGEVSRLTFYEGGKMDNGRYELTGNKLKIVKGEEWIEEYTISIENDILTLSWSEGLFGSASSEYKRVK